MSRTALIAAAASVLRAVGVAGGAFVLTRDEPRERSDCCVRIFFQTSASPDQVEAVGDRLGAFDDVSVRFVSKKEALEIMRRRAPELVEGLPSNPLPDSYDARTTYADSCAELRASLRPRPPGVDKVNSTVNPYRPAEK